MKSNIHLKFLFIILIYNCILLYCGEANSNTNSDAYRNISSIEDKLLAKYDIIKLSKLNRCNMFKTKLVLLIIQEIKQHYDNVLNLNSNKCVLNIINKKNQINKEYFSNKNYSLYYNSNILTEYQENIESNNREQSILVNNNRYLDNISNVKYFEEMFLQEASNFNSQSNSKCFICNKSFKKKEFLLKHWQLFHNDNPSYNKSLSTFCLSDYCNVFNCERYKDYFASKEYLIKSADYTLNNLYSREYECKDELIPLYKSSCRNILRECLKNEIGSENKRKIINEFNYIFCANIHCGYESFSSKSNLKVYSDPFYIVKILFKYLVFIFLLVYMIIIWVSKFS